MVCQEQLPQCSAASFCSKKCMNHLQQDCSKAKRVGAPITNPISWKWPRQGQATHAKGAQTAPSRNPPSIHKTCRQNLETGYKPQEAPFLFGGRNFSLCEFTGITLIFRSIPSRKPLCKVGPWLYVAHCALAKSQVFITQYILGSGTWVT